MLHKIHKIHKILYKMNTKPNNLSMPHQDAPASPNVPFSPELEKAIRDAAIRMNQPEAKIRELVKEAQPETLRLALRSLARKPAEKQTLLILDNLIRQWECWE